MRLDKTRYYDLRHDMIRLDKIRWCSCKAPISTSASLRNYSQLWSLFLFSRISLSLSSFHMIRAPSFSLRLTHSLTLSHAHLLTYSINHCPTFLFSLSSANSRGGGGVDFLGCMPINLSRRNLMNVQRYACQYHFLKILFYLFHASFFLSVINVSLSTIRINSITFSRR